MPRRSEIVSNANNSTITTRPPRRNEGKLLQLEQRIKTLESENLQLQNELKEQKKQTLIERREKEEEMKAKNKSYYFILSSGDFKKFAEFNEKHTANLDYHGACMAQLYLDSFKK